MFWCTIRILHVIPTMLYILAYRGLLIFYLVRLAVCGFSTIIQIYACNMIGGDEFLISGVDSDLLLIDVVSYPTIVGGSFSLRYTFPL